VLGFATAKNSDGSSPARNNISGHRLEARKVFASPYSDLPIAEAPALFSKAGASYCASRRSTRERRGEGMSREASPVGKYNRRSRRARRNSHTRLAVDDKATRQSEAPYPLQGTPGG
jgi:hypothetical protein